MSKRLLLLVHPDVVFEINETEFIEQYLERLKRELPKFDHVITHIMFSPRAPEVVDGIFSRLQLFNEFMQSLHEHSDWIGLDKKFSTSFSDALPDYFIDNPGTQIWLAGGYKDLCVRDTENILLRQLSDVILDTDSKVAGCYLPLIITERHAPDFGDSQKESLKEYISRLVSDFIR